MWALVYFTTPSRIQSELINQAMPSHWEYLCKRWKGCTPARLPGLVFALVITLDDIKVSNKSIRKDWKYGSGCFGTLEKLLYLYLKVKKYGINGEWHISDMHIDISSSSVNLNYLSLLIAFSLFSWLARQFPCYYFVTKIRHLFWSTSFPLIWSSVISSFL